MERLYAKATKNKLVNKTTTGDSQSSQEQWIKESKKE